MPSFHDCGRRFDPEDSQTTVRGLPGLGSTFMFPSLYL
jgi:hypothetical protein